MPLAVARGNINFRSASTRKLNAYVPGGPEAVDAEPCASPSFCSFTYSRQSQGAIAYDPGAKKRRSLHIIEAFRQRVCESSGRDSVFSIAAVNRPSSKLRLLTKVLSPLQAEPAHTTRPVEPRHPDTLPYLEPIYTATESSYAPDDLMARDDWRAADLKLTFDDMKVCATDAAGGNAQEYLIISGRGRCDFHQLKRSALNGRRLFQYASFHHCFLDIHCL